MKLTRQGAAGPVQSRGMRRGISRAAPLVLALCLAAPGAFAQQEAAQAEALLEQGRSLMRRGEAEAACPRFAESQRLAPSLSALIALGDCYLKRGRKASAWVTFKEAIGTAEATRQPDRERYARERVKDLEATLARITIKVSPAADASGLLIKRNGVDVDRAEWGTAIPVDPGPNEFEVSVSGRSLKTWKATITITEDSRDETLDVPTFVEPVKEAPRPTPAAERPAEPSRRPAQRTTALIAFGVGAAALGVGSFFGLKALGDKSDANAHCPTVKTCDAEGYAQGQDAHSAATTSTILFIAGGAAVGAGVVLWFTAPKRADPGAVALRAGPRAVGLEGSW